MTKIILSIFSDNNGMKLEIKKTGKKPNTWRLNSVLLNNQWTKEEIKQEIKNYLEMNESENSLTKSMGCSKSRCKRIV